MIHGYSRIDTALYDKDALLRNRYNRTVNALLKGIHTTCESVVACSSIPCTPEYIFQTTAQRGSLKTAFVQKHRP